MIDFRRNLYVMNVKTLIPLVCLALCAAAFSQAEREKPTDRRAQAQTQERMQQQRAQQQRSQAQRSQMQRSQQQRGGANMMSMRLLMTPPESLERAGVSEDAMASIKELRAGLRSEFGEVMKTMRESDEAFREAMRDPKATEAEILPKLEANAAAQLALRKKDLQMTLKIRDLIGHETVSNIMRARNTAAAGAMRDRMSGQPGDRARPEAAANPKAPWLNDQGDRIKPVRPKRPPVEE